VIFSLELIPFISYGERGGAVIKNTLAAMYDYSDETTTASKPLTLEAYTTFVLIPYIAAMLIAEDLHTDVEGGWEAMQLGIERGKRENGLQNPDPTLNEVFAANEEHRLKGLDSSQGLHHPLLNLDSIHGSRSRFCLFYFTSTPLH
jgi:hypothetical protein